MDLCGENMITETKQRYCMRHLNNFCVVENYTTFHSNICYFLALLLSFTSRFKLKIPPTELWKSELPSRRRRHSHSGKVAFVLHFRSLEKRFIIQPNKSYKMPWGARRQWKIKKCIRDACRLHSALLGAQIY